MKNIMDLDLNGTFLITMSYRIAPYIGGRSQNSAGHCEVSEVFTSGKPVGCNILAGRISRSS